MDRKVAVRCQWCGAGLGHYNDGALKIRVQSRWLKVRHDGVWVKCPVCKRDTRLPFRFVMRKADGTHEH